MTSYLIKGVSVLGGAPTDLLLEDGVIAEIVRRAASRHGVEVVDAAGLVALPGLVDLHTHLREPGREDAETVESGTPAAASAASPPCTRWPTPSRSPTPPVSSSRSGGWAARPATATSTRSAR